MFIPDPDFPIPDPGSSRLRIPNPEPQHWGDKNLKYVFLTQKVVTKLWETRSGIFIPNQNFYRANFEIRIHYTSKYLLRY